MSSMARVAGAIAAAVALAVTELVSTLHAAGPSPVSAVGDGFIDLLGAQLKDLAVAIFGTAHKTALVVGIVTVALLVGAWLGARAMRTGLRTAVIGYTVAGVIGVVALTARPTSSLPVTILAIAAGVAAGLGSLAALLRLVRAGCASPAATTTDTPSADATPTDAAPAVRLARRHFIAASAGLAIGAGAFVALGRSIRQSQFATTLANLLPLPRPTRTVPTPAGLTPPTAPAGISPYVTPIDEFFRIDTALRVPRVNPDTWQLTIDGLVDRPLTLTYADLLAMESVEEAVTLACVSNEVGGNLVGNAIWQGVPLAALLERVGVRADAEQVVGRSVDGFTAGFPTAVVGDGRTALVAYAMNGEALPARHGFPARLVVSGLYGYVSATKWLSRIELATWDGVDGYWIPRGWSKEGPVKLTSRIDVPAGEPGGGLGGARVSAGRVAVAGVAVAPSVGVAAVEVQVNDGPWQPAVLGDVASEQTWVQWMWAWDAPVGEHVLRVRAIDAEGRVQDATPRPVAPDGATGLDTRVVRVVEA